MNKHRISYEDDFYGWSMQNAFFLKTGQLEDLDIMNLVEEIESMGRSEKRELIHRMTCLITHILKWTYQHNLRSTSWKLTIKEQRRQCRKLMEESPSLGNKQNIAEILKVAYEDALFEAMNQTGLNGTTFPPKCRYKFEQILDDEFYPENE